MPLEERLFLTSRESCQNVLRSNCLGSRELYDILNVFNKTRQCCTSRVPECSHTRVKSRVSQTGVYFKRLSSAVNTRLGRPRPHKNMEKEKFMLNILHLICQLKWLHKEQLLFKIPFSVLMFYHVVLRWYIMLFCMTMRSQGLNAKSSTSKLSPVIGRCGRKLILDPSCKSFMSERLHFCRNRWQGGRRSRNLMLRSSGHSCFDEVREQTVGDTQMFKYREMSFELNFFFLKCLKAYVRSP